MHTIEKLTRDGDIMYFQVIESRKELSSFMRDWLWDSLYSQFKTGLWLDQDTSIDYQYKDNSWHGTEYGDRVERPNIANIIRMISMNSGDIVIYGDVKIVYNEHYGDWQTEID